MSARETGRAAYTKDVSPTTGHTAKSSASGRDGAIIQRDVTQEAFT
jgi:hypothetical protein